MVSSKCPHVFSKDMYPIAHKFPMVSWFLQVCFSCFLMFPPQAPSNHMYQYHPVISCIIAVSSIFHLSSSVPCWCLSGCSSNCKALRRARRSSAAQQSTSASCCSNRSRRAAQAASMAFDSESRKELCMVSFDSFDSFDFDDWESLKSLSPSLCLSLCLSRSKRRTLSASSRRVSHHWQTSSESLLSSRHLMHSHLPITSQRISPRQYAPNAQDNEACGIHAM